MNQHNHLRNITGWLTDLANVTAGTAPLADAKTKIAAMALLLADEFPEAGTFSRRALASIAAECKFFPSYAELRKNLAEWWKANRPERPALPGPETDWRALQEQHSANCAADWAGITEGQLRDKIAVVRTAPPGMRRSLGQMLHGAISRHRSHLVGLVPPEWQPKPEPPDPLRPEPDERPRSVYLTPEQLASLRAKPKVPA
jgi:hypothetical protein